MPTICEYFDLVKEKQGLKTDYQLAKFLGSTQSAITYVRKGGSIRDTTAMKIAEVLEIEPGPVLLQATLERAKDREQRSAWEKISRQLNSVAMVLVVVFAGVFGAGTAEAGINKYDKEYTLHAIIKRLLSSFRKPAKLRYC